MRRSIHLKRLHAGAGQSRSHTDGKRAPAALKALPGLAHNEVRIMEMEDMVPYIMEHGELKLIGIPCISLNDMSGKYHHAKEALLSSAKHLPQVRNAFVQYGIWPQVPTQRQHDMHAYILCVEVDSFEDIPEWYFRTTLAPQRCVVVANKAGDFDEASRMVDYYVSDNGMTADAGDRPYIICERYNYKAEGFARYSLPIQSDASPVQDLRTREGKPAESSASAGENEASAACEDGEECGANLIDNVVESVFVHVTDLRRSAEWYSMVMGLPLLEERLNGGNVYWMMLQGGTGIILDDNRSNDPETPHVRFMYKTSNIDAAYRNLEQRGIHPLYPIERPHPGLAFFRFSDPDGNSIMVMQSDYVSDTVERLDSASSPIKNRIGGIFLNVTDMNRAIRFHSEVLGIPYRETETAQENSIYDLPMKSGSGVLLDDNRHRHGDDYEVLFMLVSSDVEEAKAYLKRNGVSVFTDMESHGEMVFFTVKDPDGNVIMICSDVE